MRTPRSDETAAQVVTVEVTGTHAVVTARERTPSGGYRLALGPFEARVGRSGLAAPGDKREGDGRTPTGTFPLRHGFGTRADPGVAIGWQQVDADDRWVDDPASALYNSRQREPAAGRWGSAEELVQPEYAYAQVIGVNEERVPAAGSAIFLHVLGDGPTAGCVALAEADLLAVLRWQRPGAVLVVTGAG
jgi:L,D-peptidoglycan transpeptidase YkuD (ErfK/YbiS/YcfS/YnhG family)